MVYKAGFPQSQVLREEFSLDLVISDTLSKQGGMIDPKHSPVKMYFLVAWGLKESRWMTTSGSSSSSSSSRLCCRLILLGLIIVWVFIQECSELIPCRILFSFELETCGSHVSKLEISFFKIKLIPSLPSPSPPMKDSVWTSFC